MVISMNPRPILLATLLTLAATALALPASAADCTQIADGCTARCILNHEGNCIPPALVVEQHHCWDEFMPGYEVIVLGIQVLDTPCMKIAP
jgi:hypothetical protein